MRSACSCKFNRTSDSLDHGLAANSGQCHSPKSILLKPRLSLKKLLSKKIELRKLGVTGVMLDKRRWGGKGGPKAATEARRDSRRERRKMR
jgi:hypothetical protein